MKFGPVVQKEMSFKDIAYLELWWPFCYGKRNHLCNLGRGYQEEQFCEIILKEMRFNDISFLERWRPLCSGERNHLCNFGRRHHEKQCCEIILNLDQWFRRRSCLRIFLNLSSGSPFVQRSRTICAILVEGIMRNTSVQLL